MPSEIRIMSGRTSTRTNKRTAMNRAKNIALRRKQAMSNRDRHQVEPVTEPGSVSTSVPADWYEKLSVLDIRTPSVTKTALGKRLGKTEGAIRKAVRLIQQAVSIDLLEAESKLTPLAEFLVTKHFQRPSEMRAAEWIERLKEYAGALPDPRILSHDEEVKDRSNRIRGKVEQSSALAIQSQGELDTLLDRYSSHLDLDEREVEAELDLVEEESYANETRKLTVAFRGRMRARADFQKKLEVRGLA